MKRSRLFIFSLGLNLLLTVAVAWAAHRRHSAAAVTADTTGVALQPAAVVTEPPAGREEELVQTNEVTASFAWATIESADYKVYMENLRGIGCPEERIRDIIIADVNALFAERARDYIAPLQSQFWQIASRPQEIETAFKTHEENLERMVKEREQLFQALFNESKPNRNWRSIRRDLRQNSGKLAQLDFLDEGKRKAVLGWQDELATALSEARKLEFKGSREEIRQQRTAKEKEIRQAADEKLRALLSPDELAEYKLRDSNAAGVRQQLTRMDLSEIEARELARISMTQTEAAAGLTGKDDATKASREQLEQTAQAQIKQLLGETRYAEYLRAKDGRYMQLANLSDRLQLPEKTTVAVYEARLAAEQLATRLRQDTSTSAAEREAALAVIRTETENTVRQLVGAAAFGDFQQNSGGWLQALGHP